MLRSVSLIKPSRSALFAGLVLSTPVVLALCLLLGPSALGLPDWHDPMGRAVLTLRLSRVGAGFLIGMALAVSGAAFQGILRNPLAEPYVLGVSSGAGLGAGLTILTGAGAISAASVPIGAFICAIVTLIIVYALASHQGAPSVYGLILSGVIVSAVCSSLLMFLISVATREGMHSVLWWMLGDLEVSSGRLLATGAVMILAGCAGAWLLAPELNALALGQEMAHHVGVRTAFTIGAGLVLATLITATAVSMSGIIGFVGLIVPHVCRSLFGADHRRLIPASGLAGGLFLAVCDAAARTVLAPREIPVGVVTALLGGPFFLAILRARRQQGWME